MSEAIQPTDSCADDKNMVSVGEQRWIVWRPVGQYLWLYVALAIGALLRFWDVTGSSLFVDEGFVFHVAAQDPHQILTTVAHGDFHPPLFYLVTHYLMNFLRWPLWDYRYLTAGFSLAGIAATWAIARRLFGETTAAIAAVALALDPAVIVWDRLYRMYAPLVALTSVSWWLLLMSADQASRRRWLWWIFYCVAVIGLAQLHYIGLFVIAGQFVYALTRMQRLWPALLCDASGVFALAPWAWAMRIQFQQAHVALRLDSPEFSGLGVIPAVTAYAVPESWMIRPHFDLVVSAATLAILVAGMYIGRKTILPFWLVPIAFQVIASFATGVNLLLPRYLYACVPAFCICLAAVASSPLQTRYRVAGVAMISGIFGIALVSTYNAVFVPYYQFPDWYQVNALLVAGERKEDIIVLVQGGEYWVVKDYSGFRHHDIAAPLLPAEVDITIRWLREHPHQRVWYIENQPGFTDARRRIQSDLERSRPRLRALQQQRIFEEEIVRIMLFGPYRRATRLPTRQAPRLK